MTVATARWRICFGRCFPDDRLIVESHLQRSAVHGKDFGLQFRVLWSDGTVHWLDASGKTLAGARTERARYVDRRLLRRHCEATGAADSD